MDKGDWKVASSKQPQEIFAEFGEEFVAYVTNKGKPVRLAGPDNVNDRRLRCTLNPGEGLSVTTNGLSTHAVHARPRGEENDGIPVELGLPEDRPLSLREEMMRFIRDEMSRQSVDAGAESFEDANDFEIEDEEPFYSPYEFVDMEEEIIADSENQLDGASTESDNSQHEHDEDQRRQMDPSSVAVPKEDGLQDVEPVA